MVRTRESDRQDRQVQGGTPQTHHVPDLNFLLLQFWLPAAHSLPSDWSHIYKWKPEVVFKLDTVFLILFTACPYLHSSQSIVRGPVVLHPWDLLELQNFEPTHPNLLEQSLHFTKIPSKA